MLIKIGFLDQQFESLLRRSDRRINDINADAIRIFGNNEEREMWNGVAQERGTQSVLSNDERQKMNILARKIVQRDVPPKMLAKMDRLLEEVKPLLRSIREGSATQFAQSRVQNLRNEILAVGNQALALNSESPILQRALEVVYGWRENGGRNLPDVFEL